MLKKNKLKVVISSIIILLPILFGIIMWNDLPDIMTTHWGADGNAIWRKNVCCVWYTYHTSDFAFSLLAVYFIG